MTSIHQIRCSGYSLTNLAYGTCLEVKCNMVEIYFSNKKAGFDTKFIGIFICEKCEIAEYTAPKYWC